jgi:molybdopterin synthase catalytic subunit
MPYLTDDPIDSNRLRASVMRDSDGACIVFEGVVRNHHQGKRVESIFYEAYRPMAEKEINAVVRAVEREFPDVAIGVLHRLGHLVVGDVSIVIVCSSPHRSEAYAASRAVIDRVKQTVPIWKKERGSDGEEWVGWQ